MRALKTQRLHGKNQHNRQHRGVLDMNPGGTQYLPNSGTNGDLTSGKPVVGRRKRVGSGAQANLVVGNNSTYGGAHSGSNFSWDGGATAKAGEKWLGCTTG